MKICMEFLHFHWFTRMWHFSLSPSREPQLVLSMIDSTTYVIICVLDKVWRHVVILSNIPASPAYGVYISQLVRYSRACAQDSDFMDRAQLLVQKLLKQGYVAPRLKSSLQKFYGRHHNLVDVIRNIHISIDNGSFIFYVDIFFPLTLPRLLPDLTVYMSNTIGVLEETGTAYLSRAPEFTPGF